MKRRSHFLSALALGAAVAMGFPAAGQQDDQREEQSEQQLERQAEEQQEQQQREQQQRDQQQQREQQQQRDRDQQREQEAQQDQRQRPDDRQRTRDGQQQQQQQQSDRQQRRAMLGVAFAQEGQRRRGQEGQQDDREQQEGQRQGLEIAAVMPGGAAEQANLRRGDSLISVNGQEVRSVEEVDRIVQQQSVGDTLDLVILRNGEQQEMQVTLQAAPERDLQQGSRRPDFDRGARSSRGWLGVTLDTQAQRGQGVTINRVYPAGPAARAGLREGDQILQVTGQQVASYEDVLQALGQTRPGETVELTVASNGQQQQVSVRLDDAGVFTEDQDEFDSSTMWRDQSGRTGHIPEHDMMLEQHRRFAEQHERIERLLLEVQRDIQEIKQQMNGQSTRRSDQPTGVLPGQPAEQSPQRNEGQVPQRPDDVQQPPSR
jgi:C-terminal processing protease CtpA/Prc